MEINNLSTNLNNPVDSHQTAEQNQVVSRYGNARNSKDISDKVSLSGKGIQADDREFARIELEKAKAASFARLKEYKAKIKEYDEARQISKEAAQQTELGKMLNDPAVWEKIAENMFR